MKPLFRKLGGLEQEGNYLFAVAQLAVLWSFSFYSVAIIPLFYCNGME